MEQTYTHLSDWERTRIMVLRSASTISRELKRNGHKESYSALLAGERSKARRKGRVRKLHKNNRLLSYVHGYLKKKWSPEQISGKLARMFGKDSHYCISHEAIYASISSIIHRTNLLVALVAMEVRFLILVSHF